MVNIVAPNNKRLVWYLGMEEYIGRKIEHYPDGVFFTWVVDPTVIFGRHQIMAQEVNTDFCSINGIQTYRRKSGGGCVYADRGNLMLSYILPSVHAEQVFQSYLDTISGVLCSLGLKAVKSEHNDILVGQSKVSGNACYALKTGTIVHGTMLYDVDFDTLQQAISPSKQKLEKHGVQSVRQRVTNLKPMLKSINNIEQLAQYLTTTVCTATMQLTENDMAEIDKIEKTYLNPKFIFDK